MQDKINMDKEFADNAQRIADILERVVQKKPLTKEEDILLVWNHLDRFSQGIVGVLKPVLKANLQEIIEKETHFDEGKTDIFVKGLLFAKTNNQETYPMMKFNKSDGSVSVFIDTDWEQNNPPPIGNAAYAYNDEKALRSNFTKLFSDPAFMMRLDAAVHRHGFETINNGSVVEVIHGDAVIEVDQFKINLSPEHLDSILKENLAYLGYRSNSGGSLLDLLPDHEIRPGIMMLSPVAPLEEGGQYVMRIAGCQVVEIPSVQLFHILQEEEGGKIGRYHWTVKEVVDALSLGMGEIEAVLNEVLTASGALEKRIHAQNQEGITVISVPRHETSSIKITPMDEVSKRFYAQFGQCSLEELSRCQSLEMPMIDFLKAADRVLEKRLNSKEEYHCNAKEIVAFNKGRENLAKLMAKEEALAGDNKDKRNIGKWTSNVLANAGVRTRDM